MAELMAARLSSLPPEDASDLKRWAEIIVLDIYGGLERDGRISGRIEHEEMRPWTAQGVADLIRSDPLRTALRGNVAYAASDFSPQESPEVLDAMAKLANAGADPVKIGREICRMQIGIINLPYLDELARGGRIALADGTTLALEDQARVLRQAAEIVEQLPWWQAILRHIPSSRITKERHDAVERCTAAAGAARAAALLRIVTGWRPPPERPHELSDSDERHALEVFGADAPAILAHYRPTSQELRRTRGVDMHVVSEIVPRELEYHAAVLSALAEPVGAMRVTRRSLAGGKKTKPLLFGGNDAGRLVGILVGPAAHEFCAYLVRATGRARLREAGEILVHTVPGLCRTPESCEIGNHRECQWHRGPERALKALLRSVPSDKRPR